MQRRELAIGSLFVFILLCCMLSYYSDYAATYQRNGIALPPTLTGDAANAVAATLLFSSIGTVLVGALIASGLFFKPLNLKFIIKSAVPWYFIFAFVPITNGIAASLLLGQNYWSNLSVCMSFPATILFTLLGIWSLSRQKKE